MQLPGTQIQATKRVFCLALAPSSRLRCLLKQPRWPFRLEYHKTAPSWVQPCIPFSRLARNLTKQTKNTASPERSAHSSAQTGRGSRHRENPGWVWLRTKQPAWGPPVVVVVGGAPHGYHAAAALHTTKSVQSRVSCTEKPLRRHMQPLQETLAGTHLVYLLSYRCTPPPSVEASGERPTRSPRRHSFSHHQTLLTSGLLHWTSET